MERKIWKTVFPLKKIKNTAKKPKVIGRNSVKEFLFF